MSRKSKFVTTVAIILIIANPIRANALFGSECRDAKKSHKNAMIKYSEASKKYEIAKKEYEARKVKIEQDCLRNTQKAIKEFPAAWSLAKPNKKVFCEFLKIEGVIPIQADSPDITYKRVMEIVVNYKKCFSVEQYLDAKQWLREN